jgi:predicted DsbA family dithiol-disulfide isomerase
MPTTIEIFYDYTCEDSYALSKRLLPLRDSRPDLLLHWKAFPLEWQNGATHGVPALLALRAARAARMQGEEAFYRFHPLLFDAYHAEGRDISDPEVIREVAQAAGLDVPRLEADTGLSGGGGASTGIEAEIEADYREAQENFVFGTPTVIIGGEGRMFNPGALGPHKEIIVALIGG